MKTYGGRCGKGQVSEAISPAGSVCVRVVNLGDCPVTVRFKDASRAPVPSTGGQAETTIAPIPPAGQDPNLTSPNKAKVKKAEDKAAIVVCCNTAASYEISCGKEQASSKQDERSRTDRTDGQFRYEGTACPCGCAKQPASCCIRISWDSATPTFKFGINKKAGKVNQRYVQGTPERAYIELVSTAGKTADCHRLQSIHKKQIWTAALDDDAKNAMLKAGPDHPHLKTRISGGTTVILDDPGDYNLADTQVNAAGNAEINDRPNDWRSRDDDTDPIIYHVEAVFAVWCAEAPTVTATWGYG